MKVDADDTDMTLGAIEFDLIDANGNVISHLSTNADGEASINHINTGNYTLKETKTKKEYNLCIDQNLEVKWNEIVEYTIKNEKMKGQVKIIKEDEQYEETKLEGVKFQIIDKNNKIVEEIITDKNGEAISSRLPIGKYTIKEISLGDNKNYILNSETFEVNIENNMITPMIVKNKYKTGNLEIYKIDKDTKHPIEGIEFEITDAFGRKQYVTTNEKGIALIENIRIGTVKIKEIKTKEEYEILETEEKIEIKWNELNKVFIENEKKKGKVEVYKIDEEDKNIKIEGVEFNILDEEGSVVDTIITNKEGHAVSKELPIGNYILKEIKTHKDYLLNKEDVNIQIQYKKENKYYITNKKIKGKIKIIKTSKFDNLIRNIKEKEPIEGVRFAIYNLKNEKIEELITDSQGIAISSYLPRGRYKVKEIDSTDYYFIDENEYIINIEKNDETKEISVSNIPHIPNTDIEKLGTKEIVAGKELSYEFNIKNTGNVKLDHFTWVEYIPYEQIKITKMQTGTYNEELDYKIYYKTNQKDYCLLKNINTLINEYINFDEIQLNKNEKIIELKVEFGTVKQGFSSIEKPVLFAIADKQLKAGEEIVNKTRIQGLDLDYLVFDEAEYITKICEKQIAKKLPRTGC